MQHTEPYMIHESECELETWPDLASDKVHWRTLISADRSPTNSLTLGVAELEPGESIDFHPHMHAHPEVYYILSGTGVLIISDKEYPVRTGSTAFIPGKTEHYARNTGTVPLRLLYVFPADSYTEIKYEFPSG